MNNDNEFPCLDFGFYDSDYGCTCPSVDKSYACPLESESDAELFTDIGFGDAIIL